jgi:penicillin amidase
VLWALALVAVVAFGGAAAWLYGTIAPMAGTLEVSGLDAAATIRFDDYARPFVEAETMGDAFFAEGWLHACHRFWQMELLRSAGKGRLAAFLGRSMLETDQELWRMGVPQLAQTLERNASEAMRGHIARYVAGVNAAMAAGLGRPLEFLLVQHEPAPWTAADVYALGALMAFQSANNSENELLRLAILGEVGAERAAVFLPDESRDAGFPYVLTAGGALAAALERRQALDPLVQALLPSFAFGSNGWVVAPEKSASGHALFAFDSHDALAVPNLFYEVHLFFGDNEQIRGWSVPGLPGVINGYNERIAWGFTNTGDSQDLYIEERSPDDPMLFKDGDSWYRAEVETVEIPVKGRTEPERFDIIRTRNGTLISDDPPIALRWTIQDIGVLGIDSLLQLNRARNWEEFTAALDGFAAPALNATYADIDGNIGFRTAGLLPVRGQGEGLVPLSGSDPAARWQGLVPAADMPEAYNPAEGYLAAANARVNARGDGPLVSADNAPGYRMRRIREVLSASDTLSPTDMAALQMDWHDAQAALLLPELLAALDAQTLAAREQGAYELLRAWQGNPVAAPDMAAPMIFQAWYRALAREVFEPELSEQVFAQLYKNNYPLNHALDALLRFEHDSPWWRGSRQELIAAALSRALEEIAQAQGATPDAWRLDAMHHVTINHELGAAVPALGLLLNASPAPWGGSTSTVGRARYRYDRAYDVTAAATVRVVAEMHPDGPRVGAVMPGGQSGHPLSAHYLDQLDAWLAGELLAIADAAVQADAAALKLTPTM